MDVFVESIIPVSSETDNNITPNLDIQINKFADNEYMKNKRPPIKALFTSLDFITGLKRFMEYNLDIPIIIYGLPGCGKLTSILALLPDCLVYCPSIQMDKESRIGSILYMKNNYIKEFPKLLVYENLYILNIAVLSNNTEISEYLVGIYKLAKSRSIDNTKKIFIIKYIDLCNRESQRYITFMLDKINALTSYIFITTKPHQLDKKIRTFCILLHFQYPNETQFNEVFKHNYIQTSIFKQQHATIPYMKAYWKIYKNNNFNIGNTISQIKYLLHPEICISSNNIHLPLEKLKLEDNSISLLDRIANNFIKKKMKLTGLSGAMEIRRVIYILQSIGIDLQEFIKCIVKHLLTSKISKKSKYLILEKAGSYSATIIKCNKELIATELFLYDLIYIIYGGIL